MFALYLSVVVLLGVVSGYREGWDGGDGTSSQTDDDVWYSDESWLIDLKKDPNEEKNLISKSSYKKIVTSLTEYHESFSKEVVAATDIDRTEVVEQWKKCGGVCSWMSKDVDPPQQRKRHSRNLDTESSTSTSASSSSSSSKPNIVFVLVDDWGWNDVGYRSTYMDWTTPNIDRLAKEGIKLENYYTSVYCLPSRTALMTGRYPFRTGTWNNNYESELPEGESTIAEELQSEGYKTYMVGKWHIGYSSTALKPLARGFDYYYGFLMGKINYWTKKYDAYLDLQDGNSLVTESEELSSDLHTGYLFQTKAEEFIGSHYKSYGSSKPFFLYYSMQMVHQPLSAPSSYLDRCHNPSSIDDDYEYATELNYCATNLMMDEAIGNLTCTLNTYGYNENTYLIITSDNGGDPSAVGSSYPYKGTKGTAWNGGVKATAIIHSQLLSSKMKGSMYSGLMHVTDWYPTLMNLAMDGDWSGKTISGYDLDGVDMHKAITKGTSSSREIIVHYHDGRSSVIQEGDYKLYTNYIDEEVYEPLYTFKEDEDSKLASTICSNPSFYSMEERTHEKIVVHSSTHHKHDDDDDDDDDDNNDDKSDFNLTSWAFKDGDIYPSNYTCDGTGNSPPLQWHNAPSGTKQFLLTLTIDPHPDIDYDRYDWVVYDIDSKYTNIQTDGSLKIGSFGGTAPGVEYLYRSTCPKGHSSALTLTFSVHALSEDLAAKVKKEKTCDLYLDQGQYWCDAGPALIEYATKKKMIISTAQLKAYYLSFNV